MTEMLETKYLDEFIRDHRAEKQLVLNRSSRRFDVEDWNDLRDVPLIPSRIRLTEWKDYGLVNLHHAPGLNDDKWTEPWLPKGLYRTNGPDGRLYLLEVAGVTRGTRATVWMIRPIFVV